MMKSSHLTCFYWKVGACVYENVFNLLMRNVVKCSMFGHFTTLCMNGLISDNSNEKSLKGNMSRNNYG